MSKKLEDLQVTKEQESLFAMLNGNNAVEAPKLSDTEVSDSPKLKPTTDDYGKLLKHPLVYIESIYVKENKPDSKGYFKGISVANLNIVFAGIKGNIAEKTKKHIWSVGRAIPNIINENVTFPFKNKDSEGKYTDNMTEEEFKARYIELVDKFNKQIIHLYITLGGEATAFDNIEVEVNSLLQEDIKSGVIKMDDNPELNICNRGWLHRFNIIKDEMSKYIKTSDEDSKDKKGNPTNYKVMWLHLVANQQGKKPGFDIPSGAWWATIPFIESYHKGIEPSFEKGRDVYATLEGAETNVAAPVSMPTLSDTDDVGDFDI